MRASLHSLALLALAASSAAAAFTPGPVADPVAAADGAADEVAPLSGGAGVGEADVQPAARKRVRARGIRFLWLTPRMVAQPGRTRLVSAPQIFSRNGSRPDTHRPK